MRIKRICSVPGCDKLFNARGLCKKHYLDARRRGLPDDYVDEKEQKRRTIKAFLDATLASNTDDCILWPFGILPNGYGYVDWNRERTGAHRLMCELAHGKPPNPKMHAAHNCIWKARSCVNPRHLRWATVQENILDVYVHGVARDPEYLNKRSDQWRKTYFGNRGETPPPAIPVRRSVLYKIWKKREDACT